MPDLRLNTSLAKTKEIVLRVSINPATQAADSEETEVVVEAEVARAEVAVADSMVASSTDRTTPSNRCLNSRCSQHSSHSPRLT